jgi:hypothetical protein
MPSWGNTDSAQSKPHFPKERQVRIFASLTTANVTAAGSNTITFTGVGAQTAANVGIVAGMYVYGGGPGVLTYTGQRDFFFGNNYVTSVTTSNNSSNNQVFFAFPTTASIAAGATITFDTTVNYNNAVDANTNPDTILITAGRSANNSTTSASPAIANLGNLNQGWNYIRKKVNGGDGATRYIKETLVALANASASNTFSGNTSAGPVVSGL